ncbi:MAG: hypothetical protein HYT07_00915 [Candidatus Levybacteria bacterium]|nr:hypothetical protein [Candidatus Levybacteria bacterium]
MQENLRFVPEGEINYAQTLNRVKASSPIDVVTTARAISELFKTEDIGPRSLITTAVQELQQTDSLDQQALILTFSFLLEGKPQLHEGTEEFLTEIAASHNYTGEFSQPFKRFIGERLRIASVPQARRGIESPIETRRMLVLLRTNSEFFHDLVNLQDYFSQRISPVMPLNTTWNPLLTELFKVRGTEGLWYVYSHNRREDYLQLMKQLMSSEWTGFNRFATEPWDTVGKIVNKEGNLLDVGSSIGISAVEIAKTLQMQGRIILLDYNNPLRNLSSLRIIDYANPNRRLVPLNEALAKMEDLRENRVLTILYGVDFGEPLNPSIKTVIQDSALVHCANTIPYLSPIKLHQAIRNAIEATSSEGGILKLHNDSSLPLDNIFHSITMQRQRDNLRVLPDLVKGRF